VLGSVAPPAALPAMITARTPCSAEIRAMSSTLPSTGSPSMTWSPDGVTSTNPHSL